MKRFFLVLLGLVLGGMSFLILMHFNIEMVKTTIVPNVVGLAPEKAEEMLKKAHLSWKIFGSGRVLRTHPKVGEKVKEGRIIKLYCEVPKELKVPNLIGSQLDMAEEILKEYGCNVRKVYFPFEGPDGRVMGMFPEPGNTCSGTVTLLIDEGEPDIFERIGDLKGMDLNNIDLKVDILRIGQGNKVIDQYPKPGMISSWVIFILGR